MSLTNQELVVSVKPETAAVCIKNLQKNLQLFRNHLHNNNLNHNINSSNSNIPSGGEKNKHVIDCLVSLIIVQNKIKKQNKMNDKYMIRVNKMIIDTNEFVDYITSTAREVITRENTLLEGILNKIMEDFPSKVARGFQPLAWAVLVGGRLNEEDVKQLYTADPMALNKFHTEFQGVDITGYSPAHILCMQSDPSLSIIRFLSISNAFWSSCAYNDYNQTPFLYGRYPLHLAAEFCESVELLQILLPLSPNLTKKRISKDVLKGNTPLGLLCRRKPFPAQMAMIQYLLASDSSVAVVEDAIISSLKGLYMNYTVSEASHMLPPGSIGSHILILILLLIKTNPEVAKCRNKDILQSVCEFTRGELFQIIVVLLYNENNNVIQKMDCICTLADHATGMISQPPDADYGHLIHVVALFNNLEGLDFIIKIISGSELFLSQDECNILHCAVCDGHNDTAVVEEKVKSLCKRYPQFVHARDKYCHTPLQDALNFSHYMGISAICQVDEEVVRDKIIHTNLGYWNHMGVSLQLLFTPWGRFRYDTPVSKGCDCFRYLIKNYPEAAGVKNSRQISPYDCAVTLNCSMYIQRLLLRADPTIDLVELHRLNYSERRMAMFLSYTAIHESSETGVTIWKRLSLDNKDLLRHIVSFL